MKNKTVLILGGYGRAGLDTAHLLLKNTPVGIVLAGRDHQKARNAADRLNKAFAGDRVKGIGVDAMDPSAVESAFKTCDLVAVCMPFKGNGRMVIEAAHHAGIHYIDINGDEEKHKILKELSGAIKVAGKSFLTEAGIVPGLPSMTAYLAGGHFDSVKKITIGSLMKDPFMPYGSTYDMMSHISKPSYIYKKNAWKKIPLIAAKRIDFKAPFGKQFCFPIALAEMRGVPEHLNCEEAGVYQAGMNIFIDPLAFIWNVFNLSKTEKGLNRGVDLFMWGNKMFTRPPLGFALTLEAFGLKDGRIERMNVLIGHDDVYIATAIQIVASIMQILDGGIKEPGAFFMGHGVNPSRFIDDLKRMGMRVELNIYPLNPI
jgi:hypothetical protein